MRARRPRYPVYGDHEWLRLPRRGALVGCCDCNAVHLIRVRIRAGNKIVLNARRLSRNTASLRRTRARRKK